MQIKQTVRGNIIEWSATPTDTNGNPVTPASMTLHLTDIAGTAVTSPIAMTEETGSSAWTASWDSSALASTPLFWAIRAANPSAAAEGRIEVTANPANPAP